jgi:hypothetical protein
VQARGPADTVAFMTNFRALPLIGLCSLLGIACGDDGGGTATDSGNSETTADPSNDTTMPSSQSATEANPTTEIGGSMTMDASSGSSGTTESVITSTNPDDTSSSTAGPDDTSSSTAGPDDTSSSTGPDDTSTGPDDTSTTDSTDSTTDTGETTDTDTGPDEDCQAPATQPPCDQNTSDIFKAIGLNCSADKTMAIPIKNPVITAPDNTSYRVTTHFGNAKDPMDVTKWAWGPKEGERLLAIGTGTFPALQADGGLVENDAAFPDSQPNGNPDGLLDLPGIMNKQEGSNNGNGGTPFMNCDGMGDCSDTINPQWNIAANNDANDVFYMSFDLDVPLGTHGFIFDFAYFSEEYPNYVNQTFNDMLIVWSTSESFTGNVTFIDEQPLTVTALASYMSVPVNSELLSGTGFPNDAEGAGTGWFQAKGSAVPGETFTVAITIFDMGDDVWDTVGLIDGFKWDCVGCIPTEVMSCGVQPS